MKPRPDQPVTAVLKDWFHIAVAEHIHVTLFAVLMGKYHIDKRRMPYRTSSERPNSAHSSPPALPGRPATATRVEMEVARITMMTAPAVLQLMTASTRALRVQRTTLEATTKMEPTSRDRSPRTRKESLTPMRMTRQMPRVRPPPLYIQPTFAPFSHSTHPSVSSYTPNRLPTPSPSFLHRLRLTSAPSPSAPPSQPGDVSSVTRTLIPCSWPSCPRTRSSVSYASSSAASSSAVVATSLSGRAAGSGPYSPGYPNGGSWTTPRSRGSGSWGEGRYCWGPA